ncbi:MAG: ABC transporter permease subunit [Anaerolineaceae bacterium]|nr:ABC transporter permease subunit [Anaerolineaceae bacterium]
MLRYLLRRLLASVPILIGVSILIFLAIRLVPGDAITATLGTEAGMLSDEQRASLRSYYGLDRPIVEQYFYWIGEALHGNLGLSIRQGKPVTDLIIDRFPLTLELAVMAVVIALVVGIPLGLISALRHNTLIDLIARLFALIGLSMPSFLVGTLIIFILSVVFHTLPNSGNYVSFTEDPSRNLQQLFFPAVTLGFAFSASVMRMTRSSMLEVLNEDYIRTARSKGLPENRVITRHALWNALIPVVTLIGIEMGYLLGGTFIIEQLFALPGLGRLLVNAISQREYALVQGVVLFIALNFVIINLVVDVIYSVIDPRISYGSRN